MDAALATDFSLYCPHNFYRAMLYIRGTTEGPSGGSRAAAAVADGCREVAVGGG